jgi:hypothetical protein
VSEEEDFQKMSAEEDEAKTIIVAEEMPLAPPRKNLEVVSERYRLLQQIGEGGFGEAFPWRKPDVASHNYREITCWFFPAFLVDFHLVGEGRVSDE